LNRPAFVIETELSHSRLTGLAHMQYDLFCVKNRISRTLVAIGAIGTGALYMPAWWSFLLIAYGGYLLTGRYNQANHTVNQVEKTIEASGLGYPRDRLEFTPSCLRIIPQPAKNEEITVLRYRDIFGIGEDGENYYIFRDRFGGYVVPKEELGDREQEFRDFLENVSDKHINRPQIPFLSLRARIMDRHTERKG
jgi:hypothetical protein